MLGLNNTSLAKSTEKLSSGYRINRAADDAAGLAISEKMRRQIRGLTQASANCQDGVSLCQIADGALNEVHDILKRCEELAVQAANDTNTSEDRDYIQMELDELSKEIDRIHQTTVFNNQNIFSDLGITPSAKSNSLVGIENGSMLPDGKFSFLTENGIYVEVGVVDVNNQPISAPGDAQATGDVNSAAVANSAMASFVQQAAADAVSKLAGAYPQLFAAASTDSIQVGLELGNIDGPSNTLANASLKMSGNGSSTVMSYRLKVDTSDYNISDFNSYSDDKKADLAAVIAHEMTHLVMFDTVTGSMVGSDTFPLWFIEGTAQTSSGDNGWMNALDSSSSDADIKKYMGNILTQPYGAGYLATMYLGMAASGKDPATASDVTGKNITDGLDKILTAVAKGDPFDKAIADATNNKFSSATDFVNKFKSASGDSLDFARNLINAKGANGSGSALYGLGTAEKDAFAPSQLNGNHSSYAINKDNSWYSNGFGSNIAWPDNTGTDGNGEGFKIQAGAEKGQYIHINQYNIRANALFGGMKMDVTGNYTNPVSGTSGMNAQSVTLNDAAARGNTIDIIKEADRRVSVIRSYYGATQNRLEHTIKNLDNIVENTTAAESLIRDTDMAKEMVHYSNSNILSQAGQTMLAQANQSKQGILSLLQ